MQKLLQLIDAFIPPHLRADTSSDECRRARLVVIFTFALSSWGPVFAGVFWLLGAPQLSTMIMVAVFVMLLTPFILKRTGGIALSSNVLITALGVIVAGVAHYTGGLHSPVLVWDLPLPIMALMLGGRLWGVVFTAGTATHIAILYAMQYSGYEFPMLLKPSESDLQQLATFPGVAVLMLSLSWLYEMAKDVMRRGLDESNRSLAEARDRAEASSRGLQQILDNVGQGFVTADLDGVLSEERSGVVDAWFGTPAPGAKLWDALSGCDGDAAAWLEMGWEELKDDLLPQELVLAQLPSRMSKDGRFFELSFRPVQNRVSGQVEFLVVISDVTSVVERERAEAYQAELTAIVKKLIEDRDGFREFYREASARLEVLVGGQTDDVAVIGREMHTLKGNCSAFGVASMAALCHELETNLRDKGVPPSAAEREKLAAVWGDLSARLGSLIEGDGGSRVEIDAEDIDALCDALAKGASVDEIRGIAWSWRGERASARLGRIAEQARGLARRLEKGEITVRIEDNRVRLDSERLGVFWASFIHAVRNAVDHGLETPDERDAAGKGGPGQLTLRTAVEAGELLVELADDGRGINWDRVRERAAGMGLPASTQQDLVDALFTDGLSTQEEVSDVSGRGIGMASLRATCREMGGEVYVLSTRGVGTRLQCRVPYAMLAAGEKKAA